MVYSPSQEDKFRRADDTDVEWVGRLLIDMRTSGHLETPDLEKQISKIIGGQKLPVRSGGLVVEYRCDVWVAEMDVGPVAAAIVKVKEGQSQRQGQYGSIMSLPNTELWVFGVMEGHRRQGHGQAFLKNVIKQYSKTDVFIRCNEASKAFVRYAKIAGFKNERPLQGGGVYLELRPNKL